MCLLLYSVVIATLLAWGSPLLAESHGGAPAEHAPAKEVQGHDAGANDAQEKNSHVDEAAPPDAQAKDNEAQTEQPYQLVRTLERIQDRIAEGSTQAHNFQRGFIAEIADKMLAAPDTIWQEPKNAQSAIVYVLSGGDPRILKKLLTIKSLSGVSSDLVKGVLAYSEGRNEDALKLLADSDPRAFETRTGGHLALAKAMLMAGEDAVKAIGFLDDARLLCPGTLVDEAALRREVLLLSNAEQYERFEKLSFSYLRRFAKSVYAKSFSRSFAIAVASGKYGADPKLMSHLEQRLGELNDESRKQLYMTLAEEGVVRGRVELTRLAADTIGYLLPAGSRDAVRLQLYKAAALAVTNEHDWALATLRNIDRSKLGASDTQLLDNALKLAVQVRQPPQIDEPIKELPPLSSAAQVKHGEIAEKSEALDRARQALTQADALLNRNKR